MCIFIRAVQRVAKTKIFIMPLADNKQVLVYENEVETNAKNAMVLPIPATTLEQMTWINMQNIPSIFDTCEEYFPKPKSNAGSWGGYELATFSAYDPLPVEKVGGYSCSLIPTLGDFARLSDTLNVPANIRKVLSDAYGTDGVWSFVVCQFDNTVKKHPIAFVCNRFSNGKCFIPTRHAHGSSANEEIAVHNNIHCDGCGESPIRNQARWKCHHCHNYDLCNKCYVEHRQVHNQDHLFLHIPRPIPEERVRQDFWIIHHRKVDDDGFDHVIYIANAALLAPPSQYSTMESTRDAPRLFAAKVLDPMGIYHCQVQSLSKVVIRGNFPNQDYYVMPFIQ
jgi:hypothetical protein